MGGPNGKDSSCLSPCAKLWRYLREENWPSSPYINLPVLNLTYVNVCFSTKQLAAQQNLHTHYIIPDHLSGKCQNSITGSWFKYEQQTWGTVSSNAIHVIQVVFLQILGSNADREFMRRKCWILLTKIYIMSMQELLHKFQHFRLGVSLAPVR